MNPIRLLLSVAILACLAVAQGTSPPAARQAPWDPEVVELFRRIPVQEGGRVKPLDTAVSFLMLRVCGKRSLTLPDGPEGRARFGALAGTRLGPMEWALDAMFHPALAASYPVFQVQNREVIDALGLTIEGKKKRDRYSFDELRPGAQKLIELTQRYMKIEQKDRSLVEGQIVNLGFNWFHYGLLSQAFEFAAARLPVDGTPGLKKAFGGQRTARFSELLAKGPVLAAGFRTLHDQSQGQGQGETAPRDPELDAFGGVLGQVQRLGEVGRFFAWLPPPDAGEKTWSTLEDVVTHAVFHGEAAQYAEQIRWLALVEDMAAALPDRSEFRNRVATWHAHATGLAAARGEASRIDLEVAYHDYDFFHRALLGFMACFLLAAALWFVPRSRWLGKVAGLGMLVPTGLVVAGIVVRCILRARPPVSTLYETILFITGVAVLVALFIEWINRRRLALSLGALLGAVGMFLAAKFEALEAQDTMPTLLAVLDTNFWLATHVTSVTIGYAACLLAGFIAHVYLLGKLFGVRRGDRAFYRSIGRMVYGVLGFGLVFATIGTILGGIWANDSWGRFWGWDPKENGALMIVLWTLLILHGRLAGLWRDFGICMLAVFGNIVVGFSWWGVNLMGVGLHSYGFTAGLKLAVYLFYGSQLLVLALGLAARSLERVRDDALERARAEVRGAIEGLPEQT